MSDPRNPVPGTRRRGAEQDIAAQLLADLAILRLPGEAVAVRMADEGIEFAVETEPDPKAADYAGESAHVTTFTVNLSRLADRGDVVPYCAAEIMRQAREASS